FQRPEGGKSLAAYRWRWAKRAVNGSANDFQNLYALIDAVNLADTEPFIHNVEALMDVDQWMRTIALVHVLQVRDDYSYQHGHNMYAYKPTHGKFALLTFDQDNSIGITLDVYNPQPQEDLFEGWGIDGQVRNYPDVYDPLLKKIADTPAFRRTYWRAI